MGNIENGDIQQNWSTPPLAIEVLQQLSGEAVRMAGEAWFNANAQSSISHSIQSSSPSYRRSQSEVTTLAYRRSNSTSNFQKWKSQIERAVRWGSRSFHEDAQFSSFDPETLASQKRQWYQVHSKSFKPERYREPTSLFEHFVIAGLRPDSNLEDVEDAFFRRKKLEKERERSEMLDINTQQPEHPAVPTLEPQVLFKYPPGKKMDLHLKELAAFCFPEGVKFTGDAKAHLVQIKNLIVNNLLSLSSFRDLQKMQLASPTSLRQARVLERSPSLSELNELIYGQEHLRRDDLAFVFSLKVGNNATLYGVCLHVQEIVQRPPIISGISSNLSQLRTRRSRFLVSAPRCYCILTRVPFFELHYEMLNSIIAQERLHRITQFINGMSLSDNAPTPLKSNGVPDSPGEDSIPDWMATAFPIDNAMALTAAAAGIISDEDVTSSRWDTYFPGSATASDMSNHSQMSRSINGVHDYDSEALENQSNYIEQIYKVHDDVHSPDVSPNVSRSNQSSDQFHSFESFISSAGSIVSEEKDDESFYDCDKEIKDEDITMEWARESRNDLLQIIYRYHSLPLPLRGGEIIFRPLEHLQAIEYQRPPVSDLGLCDKYLDLRPKDSTEAPQVEFRLATAEEAVSLSLWSTATICRVLSLENVLALVTGVLLEKQVVVLCPNLGVLSAVVLSIIPIIPPFVWQSLFLPILPGKMLDFLDAPVPFIVGIQHKPTDMKMKTSSLVQVNVDKDQVKTCSLPLLPQYKWLVSELRSSHSILSREDSIAQTHPIYKCSKVQAEAAGQFLSVMRQYLDSLCSDLRSHTITSVESPTDRVSILLKDSFIDTFPSKDQSFMKLFVETQIFTVLSDSHLSSYENGDYTSSS